MAWYTAPAARTYAVQFAPDWPRKGSKDGSVGDTAHGARVSDHNPDYSAGGVVRAVDVDITGRDGDAMVAAAIADKRTRYVIHKGRIWQNPAVYPNAGGWRKYNGSDGHYGHVHLSIRPNKIYENDTSRWGSTPAPTPKPLVEEDDMFNDDDRAALAVLFKDHARVKEILEALDVRTGNETRGNLAIAAKQTGDIRARLNTANRSDGTPFKIAVQGDIDALMAQNAALQATVDNLTAANGGDPAAVREAARQGAEEALANLRVVSAK